MATRKQPISSEMSVVDAARAFVHAAQAVEGADGPGMLAAIVDERAAYHELLVALEEPCDCDPGTCDNPANPESEEPR